MTTGSGDARVRVIAHRGASGYRPEHTAAAYRLAVALGADAVEPDLVPTRDGVLVVRHENDISGTTDVADHPEFADRHTEKTIDGQRITGWFTEDFTWDELATLRARERLPRRRNGSASFDGRAPLLRFTDLLAQLSQVEREVGLVVELKHASHFARQGLDLDELVLAELAGYDGPVVIESFEREVLDRLAQRGCDADLVYLLSGRGAPADLVARLGSDAPEYRAQLEPRALAALAPGLSGISLAKSYLLDERGQPRHAVVDQARELGLSTYTWTLRPENAFLHPAYRDGGRAEHWGHWDREFAAILDTGVDGVFADHPDLAIAARDEV